MRVVFLRSSEGDLHWFNRYYRRVFPEGQRGATMRMRRSVRMLADNPEIGPLAERNLRKLVIHGTPFSLLYQLANGRVEVLHVLDGRADPRPLPSDDEPTP